ncbi:K(lysine) acetyltransferase [Entomortierella chlamydospora]|uniref:histone acetyltransferase n=1 Tax=Entomortierella chlamydospora TaxID=101097 RepID=A0A9P6MR00_9FUNG|nr:K(lysine) acetyltransferase [Entomortierella chlamydospora]
MDSRKEKDAIVEIGSFYAIIGKDGREYRVEVLGKRVTEMDTDAYVHYEGTDKRLDEWVDIRRLMPLSATPQDGITQQKVSGSLSTQGSSKAALSSKSDHTSENAKRRKLAKDEAALLTESLKSASRKRSGEYSQDGSVRSKGAHGHHGHDDDEEVPRVRNVEWILYAGFDIATWYYSPFPEEYQDCQRLFICEHCLKYIRQVESFMSHTKNCKRKKPPGTVVYSKGINKIYKVDGKTNKLYCQNLSLLAKLFLDNKTLYFDIHGFHFFVLTETRPSDRADVPVGFFSKEIVSYDGYNLACILILPPFQRKSYGKLLIEFSYELTKIEGKVGSPEKPLSDLGKLGYVSYWITAILRELYPKPWPAKRIVLPPTNRRKNRITSLKSPQHDSSQGATGSSDMEELTTTVEEGRQGLKVESHGPEPMDVDNQAPSGTVNETTSEMDGSPNREIAFSIRELAAKTGIMEEDLLETLVTMGWMTYWLSPADQATLAMVKNAKRRHRKLLKFDEQQKLLEKYGGGHDPGVTGQQDSHDYENGLGHHSISSKFHSRQQPGAHASSAHSNKHAAATAINSPTISTTPNEDQQQMELTQQQSLVQDIDPVSILEMPESEGEEEVEKPTAEQVPPESSLSTSGLKDVAVITLEMVKDYQDRHNIRLDPYLDWNAIDWIAYRSTLDLNV